MTNKIDRTSSLRKKIGWLMLTGGGLWMLIVVTGTRLSYLYTDFSFQIRAFVLFPLLLIALVYFGFIYHKPNQKTGYKQAMSNLHSRKDRIKTTTWGLLGLILIPATIAWTSIAFPAWAAKLLATEKYEKSYEITDITVRSGAVWSTLFDLDLTDPLTKERVVLRLRRSQYDQSHWRSGEHICVQGRASMFGTIIDDVSKRSVGYVGCG